MVMAKRKKNIQGNIKDKVNFVGRWGTKETERKEAERQKCDLGNNVLWR